MLGEGGFGSVYAGNRKIDNLTVAIKHIPQEHVDRHPMVLNGNLYRIPTEVLLMMKTTGGGTSAAVRLLDWYDLEEEVLLVMERPVPSLDLLSYLNDNNGPLKEGMAKDIMKQLVDAAIIMHSVGVFHRDLKPENILIQIGSDVPRVWVIDLGCGCIIQKKTYHRFSGTSAYIPPEFYKHGIYRAEPTTVWQLGAIMFEMLDGYEQFNTTEFIQNEMKVNKELSQDCQDLLKACLALNPEERVTLKEMQLHPWLTILNPTQP
ncbi:serine/threonine-protein kinase pim-1-like [Embiotoca jacksoni]|uniref:serine/threonine-protein kinase pim-1-like n=1 Tax=Embiotoca jacksoni TaxID=100190 RepID=UPI003703F975